MSYNWYWGAFHFMKVDHRKKKMLTKNKVRLLRMYRNIGLMHVCLYRSIQGTNSKPN
jgi:hypothetical protein